MVLRYLKLKFYIGLILLFYSITLPLAVLASGYINLEEDLPVELEDPYPTPYRNLEFQQYSRFDLNDDDRAEFTLNQRLEYGFARNWQAKVSLPVILGSGFEGQGIGDVSTDVLWNLNTESIYIPGMAIANRLIYPTGPQSRGVDMGWKFIAVKKVGKSALLHRLAVNAEWFHNFDRTPSERPDTYKVVVGYYRRLGPTALGIIDYVRELNVNKSQNSSNFIEIGFRDAVTPLTVMGIGLGVGVDNDSPRFRATVSYQHSLTYPFYPFRGPDAYNYPVLVSE